MTNAVALRRAGFAAPPDPQPDRRGAAVPERIAAFHPILVILNDYGRHLYDTLPHRAAARGFATIAQFFGTAAIETILAQLYRGIMRCHALDHLLRARAARGSDLAIIAPRAAAARQPPAAAQPGAGQPAACPPPTAAPADAEAAARAATARRIEVRLARRLAASQPLSFETMPSMQQIEAEVRRDVVGRTLVLICQDLGIAPSLCAGPFWNRVFYAIRCYGGSLAKLMLEMRRREQEFEKRELDHNPELSWPEQTREGIRRILGFFIGETPVDPFGPAPAAAAAGPVATAAAPLAVTATGPP